MQFGDRRDIGGLRRATHERLVRGVETSPQGRVGGRRNQRCPLRGPFGAYCCACREDLQRVDRRRRDTSRPRGLRARGQCVARSRFRPSLLAHRRQTGGSDRRRRLAVERGPRGGLGGCARGCVERRDQATVGFETCALQLSGGDADVALRLDRSTRRELARPDGVGNRCPAVHRRGGLRGDRSGECDGVNLACGATACSNLDVGFCLDRRFMADRHDDARFAERDTLGEDRRSDGVTGRGCPNFDEDGSGHRRSALELEPTLCVDIGCCEHIAADRAKRGHLRRCDQRGARVHRHREPGALLLIAVVGFDASCQRGLRRSVRRVDVGAAASNEQTDERCGQNRMFDPEVSNYHAHDESIDRANPASGIGMPRLRRSMCERSRASGHCVSPLSRPPPRQPRVSHTVARPDCQGTTAAQTRRRDDRARATADQRRSTRREYGRMIRRFRW